MRTNSPCLRVRYSCGCGRTAHISCTLFMRMLTNSPWFLCTLFLRRCRYNVEITVTMKVVSTSFVNVFSTSTNDVVSASYINVETTSNTRWLWRLYRHHLSTFCQHRVTTLFRRHISTSKQRRTHGDYESCIDVICQRFVNVEDTLRMEVWSTSVVNVFADVE